MDKKNKSNEEINKYYFEFIGEYLNQNKKILNIKNSQKSSNKKENSEKYYPINTQWMNEFKNYIGFNDIISELKKRKIKLITKKDFEWIKQIIEKSRKKNYPKKKSDSNFDINKSFELINQTVYDLIKNSEYCGGKINNSEKSLEMKFGKEKFIFRCSRNEYLIIYKGDKKDYLYSEILIIFEDSDNKGKKDILQDIKYSNIYEWFKMIGYSENNNDNKFYFYEVFFSINKIDKNKQKIFGDPNLNDYGKEEDNYEDEEDEEEISEEEKEIKPLISETGSIISNYPPTNKPIKIKDTNNYSFPIKIVQKVEKSSYIINVMESLAQILDFSLYFTKQKIKKDEKGIAYLFKDYMENIWKDDGQMFTPKNFMIQLSHINNTIFTFEEELEPYIYYNFILDKLNKELNKCDPEITKYFNNFSKKYKDFEELKEHLDKYIKDNNSIVSKIFGGIMINKTMCDLCGKNEEIEYINFNLIDIDLYQYCNNMHLEGNSLTNFYLEDIIENYFDDKYNKTSAIYYCPNCKKKIIKKIERKIVELPDYLIFRLNWGNFKSGEGFKFKLDFINPSYQYLDVNEIIEIKDYYLNDIAFNRDKPIEDSIKFKLFSTIDYFKDQNIFISKYRIKEEGKKNKWYNFWCNGIGIEKSTYIDRFTTPCLLFYEKNKS